MSQSEVAVPQIINLGAGVQSSTMALMASAGLITPMPVAAVFADTQDEPESVYRWLEWLEGQLAFPVHRVTAGRLSDKEMVVRTSNSGRVYRMCKIPAFTADGGMLRRKCTSDFKIVPILKAVKAIAGVPRAAKRQYACQWIGISLDEAHRMKPAQHPWTAHRWPLIDLRMSRQDCLKWMKSNGFPAPPRSACIFCPYHNDSEWLRLKTEEPEAFAAAVEFEHRMQGKARLDTVTRSLPYLHRSLKPLAEVDFKKPDDRQMSLVNNFGNECEGMCGV